MKILICDDNIEFANELAVLLEQYKLERNETVQIKKVYSGTAAYKIMQEESFDILFLDIEMPDYDGVRIGKWIREVVRNYVMAIVYIFAKTEYALDLFQVSPLDFLQKPISRECVHNIMHKFIKMYHKKDAIFVYQKKGCTVKTKIRDILYFESRLKKARIVTIDNEDEFYGALRDIYNELSAKHFFYCHKSILVNYDNVREFHYDKLVLQNGETIEISQAKRKEVRVLRSTWGMDI